jgi:hypothetical protein
MRAVWSFWTKPFMLRHQYVWTSPLHHLLAWVLSVESVRAHYPETTLVTDDEGARLLVDGLELEFTSVSTGLSELKGENAEWWTLGKLWAYRAQTDPFIHFDNDVFLWKRLPVHLETASVLAQNPEQFPLSDDSWYRPRQVECAIREAGGWMPEEWLWSTAQGQHTAACCGILGGRALDFLAHYANLAMEMIRHPRNQPAWNQIADIAGDNILFEQYLLSACAAYHQNSDASRFRNVQIAYLFESARDAFDERIAARVGYTHLIGEAKSNPVISRRLVERVRRDYPSHYRNCLRLSHADALHDPPRMCHPRSSR